MTFLAGGLYVPLHNAVSASTDLTLIGGLIVAMAIALTAVLVYANRSVERPPSRESEPAERGQKAA